MIARRAGGTEVRLAAPCPTRSLPLACPLADDNACNSESNGFVALFLLGWNDWNTLSSYFPAEYCGRRPSFHPGICPRDGVGSV